MAHPSPVDAALHRRSTGRCELCDAETDLIACPVPPVADATADRYVHVCTVCNAQIAGDQPLDARHWRCLQQAAWSEVPAVQVMSWRLLARLVGEAWAHDLRDQIYLDDDTLAWAREAGEAPDEPAAKPVDSNGTALAEGDAVTLIKDLEVKGAAFTAKRGTVVKNIHLTDDAAHVEGRVSGTTIVLKTEFLRKVV